MKKDIFEVLMKYSTIIWDWNGTLLDDAPISLCAVNHLFKEMGVRLISEEEYKEALDTPISKFYDRFLRGREYDFDALSDGFYAYIDSHSDSIPLHKGAKEALERAKNAGAKQYILSAAWNDDIIPALKRFGVDKYIDGVWGACDREIGSKLERGVVEIKKLGADVKKCVLVGDTYHDFECARAIGADCLLISCGHQDEKRIRLSGLEVYPTFEKMASALFSD